MQSKRARGAKQSGGALTAAAAAGLHRASGPECLTGRGKRRPGLPWIDQRPGLPSLWWQACAAAPAAHGQVAEWTACLRWRRLAGGCQPGRWGCCRAGGRRIRGLRAYTSGVSRPAAREAARAGRGRSGRRARGLEPTAAGFQRIISRWWCDRWRGAQASGHAAAMSASHRGATSARAAAHRWRH